MVWEEARRKWVRLPLEPPLSSEAAALEKDYIKLWFKKFLAGHAKDTGPGGMCVWSGGLAKDTKGLMAREGWCRVRDVVKLVYLQHHIDAARIEANRLLDPRNQKAEVTPVDTRVVVPRGSNGEQVSARTQARARAARVRFSQTNWGRWRWRRRLARSFRSLRPSLH